MTGRVQDQDLEQEHSAQIPVQASARAAALAMLGRRDEARREIERLL